MDDPDLHRELGLTDGEYGRIVEILGRDPNHLELAMYAVMWSEHCSYKSSRVHLRRLPSDGEHVLVGPGENAGVVDAGEGVAIAMRIESHNHPSAVEPYEGAATGVGGILRDIFTMGARPIALMDPLFFGPSDDARSAFHYDGVVRGISSYGNSVGVPTVGGQLTFAPCYRENPLVNVFCLGLLPVGRLVLGRASGVGNLVVLLGSLTGRDGIGGVSVLASAGLGDPSTAPDQAMDGDKRTNVQVGDPFEEKRLIEATLELLDRGLLVGIQDLGGAGLTCAVSETAARAGVGMEIDSSLVPLRESSMDPVEIMTSESQERMLAIVKPESMGRVLDVCRHHEVRATLIGRVRAPGSNGGAIVVKGKGGAVLARLPASSLTEGAPVYERPVAAPVRSLPVVGERQSESPGSGDYSSDLLALLEDPAPVYTQYDHQLFLNTVLGPGAADATLLRMEAPGVPGTGRGLALTCDANPAWCAVDPRAGTALTVAEAALNLACVGARPVALVDCLNFGNPEHAEVMWQLSQSIDGLAEACSGLQVPVVGGNVSLYNESGGIDIDPTPVVAMVGLLDRLERPPARIGLARDDALVLLGGRVGDHPEPGPAPEHALGGSRWGCELGRHEHGPLPELDLATHAAVCALVSGLVAATALDREPPVPVSGVHDVSSGGLAIALAELCRASGLGAEVFGIETAAELFSEAPSRVLVSTPQPAALIAHAARGGVAARVIGKASGGGNLVVDRLIDVSLAELAPAAGALG